MLMQVFSVFDSKAEMFLNPLFARTKSEAVRMFTDTANDEASLICLHPEDFILFHLGEFDNQSGVMTPLAAPMSWGLAIEFKGADNA